MDSGSAELVLAELLELAPGGVEETDRGDGTIEFAVYGAPGELPSLPDLKAAAGGALVDVSTEEVADDWDRRWRQFHRPLVIDGRLTVRPPWEPAGETPIDLVIDPGQAFGTGAHATTRLCLEALLDAEHHQGQFVDLGCGSGVLAIAAAKLGFAPVLALDYDPAAIEATIENALRNGVDVEVRRFDVRTEQVPLAPTVAANLLAPLLLAWAERAEVLPDRVIASGLLEHEGDRVAEAFAARGLRELERRAFAGWLALVLRSAVSAAT
ncbi:MAG TPA: 50S ribosomal protein L11 methyltransferase [Solirubrobacteraceae bacterium]